MPWLVPRAWRAAALSEGNQLHASSRFAQPTTNTSKDDREHTKSYFVFAGVLSRINIKFEDRVVWDFSVPVKTNFTVKAIEINQSQPARAEQLRHYMNLTVFSSLRNRKQKAISFDAFCRSFADFCLLERVSGDCHAEIG
jgi:hypothetical protein